MWTPPKVTRELIAERQQRESLALQALKAERDQSFQEEFNRELERVWPGMRLLWCPDPAPVDAVAMGARPGRWCILMPSQTGGPGSVKPLLGPSEEYVEPGSWVFDMLREQDWWNPEVRRERERVQAELARAKDKREAREREERMELMMDHVNANARTFVSMNRDTPWSQNVRGRRGVKK